jgi:hypothetical protein
MSTFQSAVITKIRSWGDSSVKQPSSHLNTLLVHIISYHMIRRPNRWSFDCGRLLCCGREDDRIQSSGSAATLKATSTSRVTGSFFSSSAIHLLHLPIRGLRQHRFFDISIRRVWRSTFLWPRGTAGHLVYQGSHIEIIKLGAPSTTTKSDHKTFAISHTLLLSHFRL